MSYQSLAGLVEGEARVVAVADGHTWLEPEPGTSCGGCAAASSCGSKGIGTVASRLQERRFSLRQDGSLPTLAVGERVVVGVRDDALVKGALIAYAIPLLTLLSSAITAQVIVGRDEVTLLASVIGLISGLLIARVLARHLTAQGRLAPQYLRRAPSVSVCSAVETAA